MNRLSREKSPYLGAMKRLTKPKARTSRSFSASAIRPVTGVMSYRSLFDIMSTTLRIK